ncbi:N-acetylmuramoyl-L-alanine amidase [Kineococcus sp. SYSU DK004]|uniref:N-acetylmuramoyl-L-alanine amidase n=1 Tax=Kineococcus sp. SYSU DK004 TaxID=3383125 RepID=UPI003D7EA283
MPLQDTRVSRRATLTGGAGAVAALGLATAAPAGAATPAHAPSALSAGPLAVGGSTRSVTLGAPRGAARLLSSGGGLEVVGVSVDGGSMVGVVFPGGTSATSVAVRVRRAGGEFSAWSDLPLNDSEPDPGTADAHEHTTGSDPLWVGELGVGATVEVQLPAGEVGRARLEVVDPGAARTTTLLAAPAGPAPLGTGTGTVVPLGTATTSTTTLAAAAPTIRSRAEWGADESLRRGSPGYSPTIKACVVHHTADGGSYSQSQVPAVIRGMYRYHTVSLGWSDLGYNFVVDRFGGIWEGRAGGITRPVVGAHAGGFNAETFGVSMMGDFTSVAPPAAMLESVARVIAWKLSLHGLPALGSTRLRSAGGGTARYKAGTDVTLRIVNAHRDVGFTACPGNVGFTKMDQIRSRVAQLMGGATTAATAISAKYAAIGGAAAIGAPTSAEGPARSGGTYRHYQVGSIYHSTATDAHVVKGDIREKWKALGWEGGFLGFPLTDETPLPGGAFNHFEGGSIYWSPRTGARCVRGLIRDKWASLGWETGFLGYPVTDEVPLPGGAFTAFEGGSVYWSPRTGAHVVKGAIRDAWGARGWEAGRLGYPTSDEFAVDGGLRTTFERGSITWNRRTGAVTVRES